MLELGDCNLVHFELENGHAYDIYKKNAPV